MGSGGLRPGVRLGAALVALALAATSSAGLVCAQACAPETVDTVHTRLTAPGGGHCHDAPADRPACQHSQTACDAVGSAGPDADVVALLAGAPGGSQVVVDAPVSIVRLPAPSSLRPDEAERSDQPPRRAPARLPHVLRI